MGFVDSTIPAAARAVTGVAEAADGRSDVRPCLNVF